MTQEEFDIYNESVLVQDCVMDDNAGEAIQNSRRVKLTDFVPHQQAYYDLIFNKMESLTFTFDRL
ncbi:MAG TPA: hypothetical protein VGI33_00120 [Paenibacillus sp.]|jgi:hypothetical protein